MPTLDVLATAAVDSVITGLVLGIALTICVAIALKLFAPLNAATRSFIWMATLLALPLIPPLYFAGHVKWNRSPQPLVQRAELVQTAAAPPMPVLPAQPVLVPPVALTKSQRLAVEIPENFSAALFAVYASVAMFLLLRLTVGYFRLCLLRRRTEPAPIDLLARLDQWLVRCPTNRRVQLRISNRARSPLAVGFLHPIIVMPVALALELTQQEYDDLGVHELAHIRRFDDWTNLLQRAVQALFFLQPAIYYIARKLNLERELACDDWVVAAHEGKSYARCLAKVVELRRYHRGALLLSSGAFFGKRQLVKRIEALLDKTRNAATNISMLTVVVIVVAMVAIATEVAHLPEVVAFTQEERGTTSMRQSDESRDLRIKFRGDVTFSPDEQSVAAISPDGFFILDESKGWSHRRLEVRPGPTGAPLEKYLLDGREKPLDGVGRAWAATNYLYALREFGLDSEARVSRIFAARGALGVLEEVDLIHSDRVKSEYLTKLLDQATLSTAELQRVNDSVRKISSDNDKADFLIAHQTDLLSAPVRQSYFRAVNSIQSDNDHRRVLVHLLQSEGNDPETARLVAQSAKLMNSDNDKAEVLLAVPSDSLSDAGCAMLDAARNIQSDSDKARVLHETPLIESAHCRDAWFAVANLINSDNDRAGALNALMERHAFAPETYGEIAKSVKKMNSDNDKANVLVTESSRYVEPPFFDAVNSIQSSNDRLRVLKAVLEHTPVTTTLLQVISSAAAIPDDNEKSQILLAVATQSGDPEVRAALQKACAKINSDNDYRRVASAIFEHSAMTKTADN